MREIWQNYKKWIKLGILVISCLWLYKSGTGAYENLVGLDEGSNEKWANVQADYQRRFDMTTQIVDNLSSAAHFEHSTLKDVIQARQQVTNINVDETNPESLKKFQDAQSGLSSALSRLMVVVEKYPDLQVTKMYEGFQSQIEGSENRIKVSRDNYTTVMTDYNKYRKKLIMPALIANFADFDARPYFEASTTAQDAPDIRNRNRENNEMLNETTQDTSK